MDPTDFANPLNPLSPLFVGGSLYDSPPRSYGPAPTWMYWVAGGTVALIAAVACMVVFIIFQDWWRHR